MLCPDQLPAATGALAAALAERCSQEEIELLAAFFCQLGDSLTMILAAQACAEAKPPEKCGR